MNYKTIHVHPDAVVAVETFYNEGSVVKQTYHTSCGKTFSSSAEQECDFTLLDGMVAVRGEIKCSQ